MTIGHMQTTRQCYNRIHYFFSFKIECYAKGHDINMENVWNGSCCKVRDKFVRAWKFFFWPQNNFSSQITVIQLSDFKATDPR